MQTVLPSDQHLKQKLFHKESQIISEHQKYPELFKWKTATIIMGGVTAVLLMILLVVVYNIESEQEIVTNLTFLSAIAQSSRILTNKRQILNLAHNFQQIYGTTKFQQAELLHRGSNFSTKIIKQDIYGKEDQKIIYLIELNVTQNQIQHSVRFATFMNSPFPVPDDEDFDTRLSYYSFEIKDQRKSSLLSLNSKDSLKLYSTNPDVKSVSECENYRFQPVNEQRQGSFMLLNGLVWFDFGSKDVKINTQGWKCFSPQFQTEKDMKTKLQTIFHPKINDKQTTIQLKQFQAYYLS